MEQFECSYNSPQRVLILGKRSCLSSILQIEQRIKPLRYYWLKIKFNIPVVLACMASNVREPLMEAKYKDQGFLMRVMTNVCLAGAYSGYVLGYFNTLNFDDTVRIFHIQADRALMQGLLSFCVAFGAGVGGYYARIVIDNFSRRDSFLVVSLIGILATLLLQTKLVFVIFVCRIIQGITMGLSTVLRSTYIKQFAPLELAGKFGILNQVYFAIGLIAAFLLTYLMSLFTEAQHYWRIIYILPTFFLGLHSYNFVYSYPYETPKYLLEKGRKEEARSLIEKIYKEEYVQERMGQLEKHINISMEKQDQQMTIIGTVKAEIPQAKTRLTSNKIAVRIAYLSGSLQQLTGIQVIILYAGEIMLDIEPRLQKIVPLFLQIVGLVASLYAMRIIQTHGRKELMQFGLFYMGSIYILVAICFQIEQGSRDSHLTRALVANVVIVCGLCACRWIFSMTLGPVMWLYLPEIVEPGVTGVATMINWTTAALVSFVYPLFVELAGSPSLIFCLFSVFVFVGYTINKKWMVETKDKPQWQIRKEYDQMLNN